MALRLPLSLPLPVLRLDLQPLSIVSARWPWLSDPVVRRLLRLCPLHAPLQTAVLSLQSSLNVPSPYVVLRLCRPLAFASITLLLLPPYDVPITELLLPQ